MELKKATLQCTSPGCPWEGRSERYKDHLETCLFAILACPYSTYGCKEQLPRSEMSVHVNKCAHEPMKCKWCLENVKDEAKHVKNDCPLVQEYCGHGCGEQVARKDLETHKKTVCTHQLRECDYKDDGCQFMGLTKDLSKHYKEQCGYHTQLMKQTLKKIKKSQDSRIKALIKQNADLKAELNNVKMDIPVKLKPLVDAVMKIESAIQHLQESFAEMTLTLQATSYNGEFVWKIPEIQRRRHEARTGKTVSLYSAPFYTSRHGYKLCLRLFMDGNGNGKGTHLSFFLTVMRGEYDALLQWPFRHTVTLVLLDQDKVKDIVQSFKPEPTSSSFQRPRTDMNSASGCPMFTPLSALSNPSYVKDDIMYLKCKVESNKLSR